MSEKYYTSQDLIDKIDEGWKNEEELKEIIEFIEKAKMTDEELEKFRLSGYAGYIYDVSHAMTNDGIGTHL